MAPWGWLYSAAGAAALAGGLVLLWCVLRRRQRQRLLAACAGARLPADSATPDSLSTAAKASASGTQAKPRSFVLVDSHGQRIVEVSRTRASRRRQRVADVPLHPQMKAGLQALLHQAPNLAGSAAQLAAHTYTLRFAPEIARGLADGSLHLMRALDGGCRAIAVGPGGSIAGQGVLTGAGASPGVVALAIWQVLAVVTAQKFLVDINARLAKLEKGIAALKAWLENDRLGKLRGNLAYLRRAIRRLRAPDLTEQDVAGIAQQLESLDRECLQITEAFALDLDGIRDAFEEQQLDGVGLEEHAAAAMEHVEDFGRSAHGSLMAAYVRVVAAQVRCSLPLSRVAAKESLAEVQEQLERQAEQTAGFRRLVLDRLPELKGFWTFQSTDEEHQGQLEGCSGEMVEGTVRLRSELNRAVVRATAAIARQVVEARSPLDFRITLGPGGDVVRLQRICSATAKR